MTALLPEGLEPIAVWDCRDHGSGWYANGLMLERIEWAKARVPRAGDTFRVEFYLLDAPFMIACRVRRGEDGKLRADPDTGTASLEKPSTEMLAELPPARLLKG